MEGGWGEVTSVPSLHDTDEDTEAWAEGPAGLGVGRVEPQDQGSLTVPRTLGWVTQDGEPPSAFCQ